MWSQGSCRFQGVRGERSGIGVISISPLQMGKLTLKCPGTGLPPQVARWVPACLVINASLMTGKFIAIMACAAVVSGCGSQSTPAARQVIVWQTVGSWSGHGNVQSESFTSETGALRVRWQTSNEGPAHAGAFRLTAHSAISGRPLQLAVDHRGVGGGTSYIGEDPRAFDVVVESANLDWSFTVEEAVVGTVTKTSRNDARQ